MRGEFLDLSGARLYYYAAGTRGAGEPIVLLHGFPTSGHLWSDLVPLLPAGHRVVVVDLLGYGRSDPPRGAGVGVRDHAERVIELLDVLGIAFACIVGHEIGGGVAQWLALRHPQRVSRLCLIDSVAFDAWPRRDVRLTRALLPVTRHLPPQWLVSALRSRLLRGYLDHERGARSAEQYVRPFASMEGRDVLVSHLLALNSRDTRSLSAELKDIAAPTAVVWGQYDPFLPVAIGRRLHRAIPRSTFDVLPGVRHFTPEESPGKVADVLTNLLRR